MIFAKTDKNNGFVRVPLLESHSSEYAEPQS